MTSVIIFQILLAAICFLILFYFINYNAPPRNWPLVGMLPNLLRHAHRIHEEIAEGLERLGDCTFLFKGPWFGNMDMLITADPANIHYIMSSNFSNFEKGSELKKRLDLLGDGIFTADLDLWKKQRKVAQTLVNHQLFYQFMVKTSQDKVEKGLILVLDNVAKQGLVVDLQDLFQRFTFDATCLLVTGYDPGCLSIDLPKVPFSEAMDNAMEAIFYRNVLPESIWKLQRWLSIGEEQKLKKAWQTLDQLIAEIVSAKKEKISKGTELISDDGQGVDLLTSYMSEDFGKGSKSDDKFLRDTVMNFMLAGRDTTSSGLSWFFWLLSKNPLVENKIREELKASTLPETEAANWRLFDTQELKRLVYLHAALCESLRLYPPVPFTHKSPIRPDTLPSGHHVKPRERIVLSSYAMGRMSSIWGNDCYEFKPERWISPRGGIKHVPSYKFFAFNAGPRVCLGKDVAFIQMKAVASAIIYNYHVQVVDGQTLTPSRSIILHMKHGMKVKLARRWA